jgi:hypothetical protein
MMSNDPILILSVLGALIGIPLLSLLFSKIHLSLLLITPFVLMALSVPLFLFVVIVPDISISRVLFYISLSVWTGGFFSIFINLFMFGLIKASKR